MAELTYSDLTDHAVAYLGGSPDAKGLAVARRAVLAAYDEVAVRFDWSFYRSVGRIVTVAAFSDGTVNYDPNTRVLSLVGANWPDWAADGTVYIDDVGYEVDSRPANDELVISASTPIPSAANATYRLVQEVYPLPANTLRLDRITAGLDNGEVSVARAGDLVAARRRGNGPARPRAAAVVGFDGGLGLAVWPAPDAVYQLDYLIKRRPSALAVDRREAGTVTLAAASAVVTGQGTDFDSRLVGTVFRAGYQAKHPITGEAGEYPAQLEARVESVASATSLTLDAAAVAVAGPVKYVCSSVADVDRPVVGRYLLREVERQCRLVTRMKPVGDEAVEYQAALLDARAADSRHTSPRAAGVSGGGRWGLKDYPDGTDFLEE